jgi:hypothetical protein
MLSWAAWIAADLIQFKGGEEKLRARQDKNLHNRKLQLFEGINALIV